MAKMAAQEIGLHTRKGSTRRLNLCDHINTIAALFNHPANATHLTFNPLQARKRRLGCIVLHERISSGCIPLRGSYVTSLQAATGKLTKPAVQQAARRLLKPSNDKRQLKPNQNALGKAGNG
jgi:hypothetical protein